MAKHLSKLLVQKELIMANPTFEESLQELEQIVTRLEQGDVPLEEALDAFQKGMVLSKQCKDTLSKAEKSLTKMMTESNEEVPFEEENQ
jgi:exodeoxyribonuclease VII small subunit